MDLSTSYSTLSTLLLFDLHSGKDYYKKARGSLSAECSTDIAPLLKRLDEVRAQSVVPSTTPQTESNTDVNHDVTAVISNREGEVVAKLTAEWRIRLASSV